MCHLIKEEIRKACNFKTPKTKSGQEHISRSYQIEAKLKEEKLESQFLPISDKYLEKFFPSFDILPVTSMENIREIYDFTNIKWIDMDSFFNFSEDYLHIKKESNNLIKEIYNILKDELQTTDDLIALMALNKTPFNANNFDFIKKYAARLKQRDKINTNFDFKKYKWFYSLSRAIIKLFKINRYIF